MSLSNKARRYIEKHYTSKNARELSDQLNVPKGEVADYIDSLKQEEQTKLTPQKRILFTTIALLIPILFFIGLEMMLRYNNYKGDLRLFEDITLFGESYKIPNQNFAARYFSYITTIPNPSKEIFKGEKPDDGYRIFGLGGSSAAGYPYGFNALFTRVTRDVLTDVTDAHVEAVNLGISAVNSYTIFDQVDEVIAQNPDAVLMYMGHNEYYGALGVGSSENMGQFPGFIRFYLKLQRFKTFLWLRDGITYLSAWIGYQISGPQAQRSVTLMERMVENRTIALDGAVYEAGVNQFRSNMEQIVQKFRDAGIPLLVGSLASNIKDQPPFVSVPAENLPEAGKVYKEAEKLYQKGNITEAKSEYTYAKDLDGLKFRAPEKMNEIIRDITTGDGVHYVGVKEMMAEAATDSIIGDELMLEHLHPNTKGYFLIGKAFTQKLLNLGIPGYEGEIHFQRKKPWDSYYSEMHMTEFDEQIGFHRVKTLKSGWPFRKINRKEEYIRNYRPKSMADSLAFRVVHFEKHWDKAKIELGNHYSSNGNPQKAFREFQGLIRNQPWNPSPYKYAAKAALEMNRADLAQPILQKAYELEPKPDPFVTKMLGALEIGANNLDKGISLLETSVEVKSNDAQAWYNLSGGYAKKGEFKKALNAVNKAYNINPRFPGLMQWRRQLQKLQAQSTRK